MGTIKDFKYKVIKNFLNKEEVDLLSIYCQIKHRINTRNFELGTGITSAPDTSFYGEAIFDSLLIGKTNVVENESGLFLNPTYSFWRLYTKYSSLARHKDRPSCEISLTINLGSDGTPWPIFVEDKPIFAEPGDAIMYSGCELFHHREEYKGTWHAQVFLHYVDKNGPHKDLMKDGRLFWGLPSKKRI